MFVRRSFIALRALWRVAKFLLLVLGLRGLAIFYACLPRYRDPAERIKFARQFFFKIGSVVFPAQIHLSRDSDADLAQPCLYVSNHISWMDILALYSILPIRFVSKGEVKRWPLIGYFARWSGTIFFTRGVGGRRMIVETAEALARASILVFPEGTSTRGQQVLRFLPPIFRSAISAEVPVVPVSLHYRAHGYDPSGKGISFSGTDNMLENIARVSQMDKLDIYIHIHRPISTSDKTPLDVAQQAQIEVAAGLKRLGETT